MQPSDTEHTFATTRRPRTGGRCAVVVKRAREVASIDDGMRVLVDRLWPRGLTKEHVAADLWLQDVAPSDALRRWFGHEPSRWLVFSKKYRNELEQRPDLLRLLDDLRRKAPLTLLYGARDAHHNHAIVLQQVLTERRFAASSTHRSEP
jgi:uncharacterized protein YeaO (DUF488 family)